jgi:hypothetical protein
MSIEALLVPWLASTMDIRVTTEIPDDLQAVLPLARVIATGGASSADNPRFRVPRVSVDWFADGYGAAADLALAGDSAMRKLAGVTIGAVTVTQVETVSLPAWVPYADTNLRHFVSAFQLHLMANS